MNTKISIISNFAKDTKVYSFSSYLNSFIQNNVIKEEKVIKKEKEKPFLSFVKIDYEYYFSETFPKENLSLEAYPVYEYEYSKNSFSDYEKLFRLLIKKALLLYPNIYAEYKWLFLAALKEYLVSSTFFENFTAFCKNASEEEKENFNPTKEIRYFKSIVAFIDKKKTVYYLNKWIFEESGLPLNYKSFEQIYFFSKLDKQDISLSIAFRQNAQCLEIFQQWKTSEKETLLKLLQVFKPSKNITKELIQNLHTLAKREKIIAKFLQSYANLDVNEKTQALKDLREKIKKARYPLFHKKEKKVKNIIASFEAPDEIKKELQVLFPDNLEEDYFQILLTVKNTSILKKYARYFASTQLQKNSRKLLKSLEL